jgi:hypothetical protein
MLRRLQRILQLEWWNWDSEESRLPLPVVCPARCGCKRGRKQERERRKTAVAAAPKLACLCDEHGREREATAQKKAAADGAKTAFSHLLLLFAPTWVRLGCFESQMIMGKEGPRDS